MIRFEYSNVPVKTVRRQNVNFNNDRLRSILKPYSYLISNVYYGEVRMNNVPSNWQVVDGDLTKILFAVDDEETTEGDATLLIEYTVFARYAMRLVRYYRNVHRPQSACNHRLHSHYYNYNIIIIPHTI